jgi:Kef-type K+ transport system membrane component KefB
MSVDSYNGDGGFYAVLFLVVSLVVTWLFIYTAVRAAVGHALDRAKSRLIAEAHTTPGGVEFVVANVGTAPAFDLSVRWVDGPSGIVLAHTLLLGINDRLEWTLVGPVLPGEALSVRRIKLEWGSATDPSYGRQFAICAVLVPSRIDDQN